MRPSLRHSLPLILLLVLTGILAASDAQAKSTRKVSHAYDRVWPTAVRFLRIDEGLKIVEKDADTGYVLFELADEGKRFTGSVEVIRRQDESERDAVELVVRIKDRPSYMEHAILDRMLLKIREELGRPKPPSRKKAPPKKEESKDGDKPKDEAASAA
jgi:hypothetical protein